MTAHLVAADLAFAYAGQAVLRGATLAVPAGRVTALVGPSGAGKTTLVWLMAGLARPAAGRVAVSPSDDPDAPGSRPFAPRPGTLGMVFQTPALWSHLTAEAHLRLVLTGARLTGADRAARVQRMLARMNLDTLARRRPAELSGGERQRLAIARALVADPEWLLLDEPLAHLDGPAREGVFDLLRQALAGTRAGVLLATHDTAEALRLADLAAVLLDGRIVQAGPTEEVYRRPVSLAAARTLGPADEIAGLARGGALMRGETAVLDGLPPKWSGPRRLILRPEDATFAPDPAGPAAVLRCELCGGDYLLRVTAGDATLWVRRTEALAPGTRGRLTVTRRESFEPAT
jgi:ABC-type sulfate/molybdate transport systems ATPase subunit